MAWVEINPQSRNKENSCCSNNIKIFMRLTEQREFCLHFSASFSNLCSAETTRNNHVFQDKRGDIHIEMFDF